MKVVILCGGMGTRISEETQIRPKPMVEIGGVPILWHIMKIYGDYGIKDFILGLGYKGEMIKQYFINHHALASDVTVYLKNGKIDYANPAVEDWKVAMVDTGRSSMTGGRLRRLEKLIKPYGTFFLTYGDGLSDINITSLLAFHREHKKMATVMAVRPAARFGNLVLDGNRVTEFKEKPQTGEGWINGGFFIFESAIFDYLENDLTVLEEGPLERLASENQLMAYKHDGFWQCMDTLRDRNMLEALWSSEKAPWKLGGK